MEARYTNPDNDRRGPWKPGDLSARNYYSQGTYSITCPSGRVISGPPSGTYWRVSEAKLKELDADRRIWWGDDGNNVPAVKRFLSEVKQGRVPQTLWTYEEVGHTQEAKKEVVAAVRFPNSDSVFDTPKPTRLLRKILQIGASRDDEAIVMDFFAGSGSTMHAVFAQNAEDGGNRRTILVQLPEPLDPVAQGESKLGTIADICRERIRHAGSRIKEESGLTAPSLDIGFRVLKVDSTNMKDVYYSPDESKQGDLLAQIDNIKADRTPEDLLFQVLVDWGVDLALPIAQEKIDGKTVFFVDGNALAACFDQDVTDGLVKEIAKRKPLRAVFRDSSYSSDSVKVNVEQIFRLLAPSTEIRSL